MKENSVIDLLIQLSFETGQAWQNIYNGIGLENVIDFNDILFAKSKGAQWNLKRDISNITELFKIHKMKQTEIDELNNLTKQLEQIKNLAREVISERK